tara:strand:+ start:267 stop:1151 length:885 start_codon:yes stop_codon:yes gene_type:complete
MTVEMYDADGVLLDTIIDRPKFRELRYKKGREIPEQYDIVQLKMDGMWGCMKISHGQWGIYSRTGKLKADGVLKEEDYDTSETILLGEYIKNSHWGHKMDIDGNFYAFDCIKYQGLDLTDEPLKYRLNMLQNILVYDTFGFVYELTYENVSEWKEMWKEYVTDKGYEGLVFKDSRSKYYDGKAWARMKGIVEIDYVCSGFRPADKGTKYEGQVGSVIGTLIDKDVHVTCGGLSEDMRLSFTKYPERYIGQVFTAKGNNWYPSGAIRHPQFVMWRTDKEVDGCTYSQIPEGVRKL